VVVEPESAACVTRALAVGRPVLVPGDLRTSAEMLSCGVASAMALEILRRHDAQTVLVGERGLNKAKETLRHTGGPETTASGAAGLAGLLRVAQDPHLRSLHQLTAASRVLLVATEGPSP
jgi:diaminopropionate ammonia-lyase